MAWKCLNDLLYSGNNSYIISFAEHNASLARSLGFNIDDSNCFHLNGNYLEEDKETFLLWFSEQSAKCKKWYEKEKKIILNDNTIPIAIREIIGSVDLFADSNMVLTLNVPVLFKGKILGYREEFLVCDNAATKVKDCMYWQYQGSVPILIEVKNIDFLPNTIINEKDWYYSDFILWINHENSSDMHQEEFSIINEPFINEESNCKESENISNSYPKTYSSTRFPIFLKVVGVSYDNRQQVISHLQVGEKIQFIRELNNKFDQYAVKVCTEKTGQQIGYISKEQSQLISNIISEGKKIYVTIASITGGGKYENYGVNIKVEYYSET